MTRSRLAWLALVALVATAASATAARGAGGLGIAAARATFPERALVLTLPARVSLDPQNVRVLENGEAVDRLSVVPARSAAAQSFGVVLALDASNSMRGAPVAGALAAARAFAAERAPAHRARPRHLQLEHGHRSRALDRRSGDRIRPRSPARNCRRGRGCATRSLRRSPL